MDRVTLYVTPFEDLYLHPDFPLAGVAMGADMRFTKNRILRRDYERWQRLMENLSELAYELEVPIHTLLPVEVNDEQREQEETDQ